MPHPVDTHVGKQIKARRNTLHVTQDYVANLLGISFQQLHKYESGYNRVSTSRLFDVSRILGCPITFFFEGFGTYPVDETRATTPAELKVLTNMRKMGDHQLRVLTQVSHELRC